MAPETPTKLAPSASSAPGPQGRVEPQPTPAPSPTPAPGERINAINTELVSLDRVLHRERREALLTERDRLTRQQLGQPEPEAPEPEPTLSPEVEKALTPYSAEDRALIDAHAVEFVTVAEQAGMTPETVERGLVLALKFASQVPAADRYIFDAPDGLDRCDALAQKVWGREYEANRQTILEYVTKTHPEFGKLLDRTKRGNDFGTLQAILVMARAEGNSVPGEPTPQPNVKAPTPSAINSGLTWEPGEREKLAEETQKKIDAWTRKNRRN